MLPRLAFCLWLVPLSLACAQAPAKSPALLKAPPGFQVELILQAPDIEAPTALAVAPNGDVYYAEDPMDMRGPTTKNIDKIWLLKGGDPKKILIADQMWAVMGLEIVRDKLFVVHPPFVSVFTLDAEGKSTGREDLFSDLGPKVAGLPSFNDHVCSGIRMAADGWLYVSIGDKGIPAMTRKETDQGSVHVAEGRWRHSKEGNVISLEGGGVIRFRPDGTGLEVFASGTRNHLDVPLDQHDRIFVRDNTNDGGGWNTRLMYLPRGAFLGYPWTFTQRPSEAAPLVHDFGGGSPCGGWVYLDDGLPVTFQGRIFHCEWGKGKVYAVKVKPRGANFDFEDEIKFLDPDGTTVKDFRPFTIRPTADGRGFYVTDWANSGWTNKTVAGRLWKVTYAGDDVKPQTRIDTTKASTEALARALAHPAHSQRVAAQRELMARASKQPREVGQALAEVLREDPLPYRHAVWLAAVLPDNAALSPTKLISHVDPGVRIEATRMLAERDKWGEQMTSTILSQRLFAEQQSTVKLHQYTALRGRKLAPAVTLNLLFTAANDLDSTVRHALGRFLREDQMRDSLFEAITMAGGIEGQPEQTAKMLCWLWGETFDVRVLPPLVSLLKHPEATVRAYAVDTLHRNYKDRKPYAGTWWGTRPEQQKPPAREVAWEGTSAVREAIVAALGDRDSDVRRAAVKALVEMRDPATFEPLKKRLADEKTEATQVDLVRAITGLRSRESGIHLGVVASSDAPTVVRVAALQGIDVTTLRSDEFMSKFLDEKEPVLIQVAALQALARLKTPGGPDLAVKSLSSPEAAVRQAALATLAASGDATRGKVIRPLLKDRDKSVQVAAIGALGALKDRDSIPALLEVVPGEELQFVALTALAQMPDRRAVSAYLLGLGSKNATLRQISGQAISTIRDQAAPILEQLAQRNELPRALLPELRTIYSSFEPVGTWALIGPFPDDGKVHPPQTELNLDAKYEVAGKQLGWRKGIKGDAKNQGKVDLVAQVGGGSDVVAYAHAEIDSPAERPATLRIGSDDTMRVWLNGTRVFEFAGSRGWSPDSNRVNVTLKQGKNLLLVQCGNKSGPWEFSLAVSADASKFSFLQGGEGKPDLEAYRAFARKNSGDPERGKKLYHDVKGLACIKCHALSNDGGKVGPALDDIGLKYKREDLMTSILEPSRTIANGYETLVVELKIGKTLTGVDKGAQANAVLLMDDEGKLHTIPRGDIEEMIRSPVSRMPNGLNDGMTLQDFADLIAYLETRRQK